MKSNLQVSYLGIWVDSGALNEEILQEEGRQIWEEDDEVHLDRIKFKAYETFKWACPGDKQVALFILGKKFKDFWILRVLVRVKL